MHYCHYIVDAKISSHEFGVHQMKKKKMTIAHLYRCTNLQNDLFEVLSTVTGWRRGIGCLKSQVSFHKRATSYRALLQKMTRRDKAFSPPWREYRALLRECRALLRAFSPPCVSSWIFRHSYSSSMLNLPYKTIMVISF